MVKRSFDIEYDLVRNEIIRAEMLASEQLEWSLLVHVLPIVPCPDLSAFSSNKTLPKRLSKSSEVKRKWKQIEGAQLQL